MTFDKKDSETESFVPFPIGWLQILAGASTVIAIAGLIALMSQGAWAQQPPEDRKGFEPGGRPFNTNPFVGGNPPGAQGGAFEDEEEDFPEEFFPNNPPGNPPSGAANSGGGSSNGLNVQKTAKGVSVGGTPPGGVISRNEPGKVQVDNESAEGSREVITDFNFPDADILDIAKALGKLTGKNFILDKDVKGRVTIISNGAITVGDAWKAFLTALDMNGFALIPSGKFVRIARQRDARDKQLKTYTGDYSPDTDALITRVFPLKYLSADEVARNFRSFMPANSRIIPYDQTNTVIVTDTGSNIAKLNKLLEILDVEGYDAGIEVVPVKYASAVELSKLIDTLVPGTAAAPAAGAPRFGGGGKFSARRTKEGGIINTIIADERTNTLIVHANSKGADQVRELVARLDQKLPAAVGGGRVHVIYLQFAESEQIAQTLNNLSSTPTTAARPASPAGGTGVNPVQASLFEGQIKVSPDKATNSLVVTASPADFVTVQRVINKLDIPRDQVYAEVVIMELQINRDFTFSTNVINPVNGIGSITNTDLVDFALNPLGQKGAILGFKANGTTEVNINGTKVPVAGVQGLVKALQTRSNANVLATPQILALDNTEATFESAERIPVLTTTAVQGAGIAQSTTKENVSLSITIKPQINKIANFVKLEIATKLEDISSRQLPAQIQNLALATTQRNAKTSIVVADADTVVLGGLTRDNSEEIVSQVPLLGDIPLLGWLFKSRQTRVQKSNLLIFITPHIVRQYETVRALLDKKLKERDEFVETGTGGVDPQRAHRDKMIRSLPEVKDILSYKPQTTATIGEEDETGEAPAAAPVREATKQPAAPAPGAPAAGTPAPAAPAAPAAPVPVDPALAPLPPTEAPPSDFLNSGVPVPAEPAPAEPTETEGGN